MSVTALAVAITLAAGSAALVCVHGGALDGIVWRYW